MWLVHVTIGWNTGCILVYLYIPTLLLNWYGGQFWYDISSNVPREWHRRVGRSNRKCRKWLDLIDSKISSWMYLPLKVMVKSANRENCRRREGTISVSVKCASIASMPRVLFWVDWLLESMMRDSVDKIEMRVKGFEMVGGKTGEVCGGMLNAPPHRGCVHAYWCVQRWVTGCM